jgi:hypothetical protein
MDKPPVEDALSCAEVVRRGQFLKDHHPAWGMERSRALYEELKSTPYSDASWAAINARHAAAAEQEFQAEFGVPPRGYEVSGHVSSLFPAWAAQHPAERPAWWGAPGTNFPEARQARDARLAQAVEAAP